MKSTNIQNARWLSNPDEISSASNESLLRSILTVDGKGSSFKEQVLHEILNRVDAKYPIFPED